MIIIEKSQNRYRIQREVKRKKTQALITLSPQGSTANTFGLCNEEMHGKH